MNDKEQTFKLFDSRISNGRTALKNHAKKMGFKYYSEYIYESYKYKTNRQIREEIEAAGCKFVPKLASITNMNARIVKALQDFNSNKTCFQCRKRKVAPGNHAMCHVCDSYAKGRSKTHNVERYDNHYGL